ncbi:MAG: hypothetical protein ACLTUL_03040 [Blautia faecis]
MLEVILTLNLKINIIYLTKIVGFLVDMFADGHIEKIKEKNRKNSYQYQCILSIGSNKIDELRSTVKERHYSCYPHTKSTHRVVFSSMELVEFILEHNFGIGAENKIIPNFYLGFTGI